MKVDNRNAGQAPGIVTVPGVYLPRPQSRRSVRDDLGLLHLAPALGVPVKGVDPKSDSLGLYPMILGNY